MTKHILPAIVAGDRDDEAAKRIRDYYTSTTPEGRPSFSGARFDFFASEHNPLDRFTSDDLLSVGLLGVHVPGNAIVQFLEHRAEELNRVLAQLPDDIDLPSLTRDAFNALLGNADSPGSSLWNLLRSKDRKEKLRVGPTLASKLMARKRPQLIPIWDSRIGAQLGLENSGEHWALMWNLLSDEETKARLASIREKSGIVHISLLRTFDVAVWHADKFDAPSWEPTHTFGDDPEYIGTAPGE